MTLAAAVRSYGSADSIELLDLPIGEPGDDDVLVSIRAAGVNLVDALLRDGYLETGPLPLVLGCDFAGVVEKVGAAVTHVAPGDEVYGYKLLGNGTYVESAIIPARFVALKPRSVSFVEAAAIPCAGLVAYDALVNTIDLQPGETVVIGGASGGVGHFAVQIAKARGAVVVATASPRNTDFVSRLGADHIVDHSRADVAAQVRAIFPDGVDAGLPTVTATEAAIVDSVRDRGRLSWINSAAGPLLSRGIAGSQTNGSNGTRLLDDIRRLVDDGGLHTGHVDRIYRLSEAAEAQRAASAGHVTGKLVVEIG